MAATKLFQLITFTALALIASSYGPTPVNALSAPAIHARHHALHDSIARKKRNTTIGKRDAKRCRERPSSSAEPAPSSTAAPAPAPSQGGSGPSSSAAPSSASSPSPSPSPSPAPAPPTNGNDPLGGGLLGLAWPNGPDSSIKNFLTPNVGALYTWSPHCPTGNGADNVPCYQMLWGGGDKVAEFKNAVKAPGGNKRVILGFNEPNEPGQSNLSPQDACGIWRDAIEPLGKQGYTLVSPATSGNPNGLKWMDDFFGCCSDCTVHAMAVHWYDIHAADFKAWVQKWHDKYQRPVIVTEYAVQNFNGGAQANLGDIFNFHKEVTPWLQEQPWVLKAFPFGFMHNMVNVNPDNQLMKSSGEPTDLGWSLINLQF